MTDRLRGAVESLVSLLIPQLTAALAPYAQWEYRVMSVTAGPPVLLDLVPTDPVNNPFGTLAKIKLYPGPDGSVAVPAVGSIAIVRFSDGNLAKPAVCGLDPDTPVTRVLLGGVVGSAVARAGDQVTITQAQITAATMVAGSNAVTISAPLVCTITSGSAIASSP